MKKNGKRLVSILLSVMMVFSVLTPAAFAQETDPTVSEANARTADDWMSLKEAVADSTVDEIKLSANIQMEESLVVSRDLSFVSASNTETYSLFSEEESRHFVIQNPDTENTEESTDLPSLTIAFSGIELHGKNQGYGGIEENATLPVAIRGLVIKEVGIPESFMGSGKSQYVLTGSNLELENFAMADCSCSGLELSESTVNNAVLDGGDSSSGTGIKAFRETVVNDATISGFSLGLHSQGTTGIELNDSEVFECGSGVYLYTNETFYDPGYRVTANNCSLHDNDRGVMIKYQWYRVHDFQLTTASVINCRVYSNGVGLYASAGTMSAANTNVYQNDTGTINNHGGNMFLYSSNVYQNKYSGCSVGDYGYLKAEDSSICKNQTGVNAGSSSTVKLNNCEIKENVGDKGGLYFNQGYMLEVDNCNISNNTSAHYGGGLYFFGSGEAYIRKGTTIRNNTAKEYGGGIYSNTISFPLIISNSTIEGNSALKGGGMYLVGKGAEIIGTPTDTCAEEAEISGNSAVYYGGGIYCADLLTLKTDKHVKFSGNTANELIQAPDSEIEKYPDIKFGSVSGGTHPLNNYDISYFEGEEIRYITGVLSSMRWPVLYATPVGELSLPVQVRVDLDKGESTQLEVVWDKENYNSLLYSEAQILNGSLVVPQGIENRFDLAPTVHVEVTPPYLVDCANNLETLELPYGIPNLTVESLLTELYPSVTATTVTEEKVNVPIHWYVNDLYNWDVVSYPGERFDSKKAGEQTIYGMLRGNAEQGYDNPTVVEGSTNPFYQYVSVKVNVSQPTDIVSVEQFSDLTFSTQTEMTAQQLQTYLEDLHSQIRVELSSGGFCYLPVEWKVAASGFDGEKSGTYHISGDILLEGYELIKNPDEYLAEVEVAVKNEIQVNSNPQLEPITVGLGTTKEMLASILNEKYPSAPYHDISNKEIAIPVTWDASSFEFDGQVPENYMIYGNLNLSGFISQGTGNYQAQVQVTVYDKPIVASVESLAPISVKQGTPAEEVLGQLREKYPKVKATLNTEVEADCSVTWDISTSEPAYNGDEPDTYTIYGTLNVETDSDFGNPNSLNAEVQVTVKEPETPFDIISVDPTEIEVSKYMLLSATDKIHAIGGTASVVDLPKAKVHLRNGTEQDVAVNWHVSDYKPKVLGTQSFEGEFIFEEGSQLVNRYDLKPPLDVTVVAPQYDVLEVSANGISVEVLPGTTLAEIQSQLEKEGRNELHVDAFGPDGEELFLFSDFTLEEEENLEWASEKDIPGDNYELKISMPSGFTAIDESILDESAAKVKVIVSEPLEITEVKPQVMNAYQSVEPENLENIPEQVTAVLSNGLEIPIDVEWKWEESGYQKDLVGSQPNIWGKLVNLPSKAKQPAGEEKLGLLTVNVQAVEYEVTDMQSEELFETKALLTLEEITELLDPAVTLTISSVTPGIALTTTYKTKISLETEKNPEFNRKFADTYPVSGSLQIPSNIAIPEDSLLNEVVVQTLPVEVKKKASRQEEYDIEPISIMVDEGTAFADIEKPETAVVTFNVMGPDGEYKKETVAIDWGTGEGYDPYPEDLTDETPVEMTVYGTLAGDSADYAKVVGVLVPLTITMVRSYEITEIAPARFPASGSMEVKLGSSLEDIYNALDTHTVDLTLRSASGTTSTRSLTFQLRADENPDYDPMTEGTYTLTAYLELPEGIRNPDELKVEVVVKTTKYTISSIKGERIGGVISGTAFEDVPLPEMVTVNRNDGKTDQVGVTWNGTNYKPTKIGSQVVRGMLNTPLPVHLENPNNRQPSAVVTIVNPEATILSLKEVSGQPAKVRSRAAIENTDIPGYKEYRYLATVQYKDGTVSEEIISVYVDLEMLG